MTLSGFILGIVGSALSAPLVYCGKKTLDLLPRSKGSTDLETRRIAGRKLLNGRPIREFRQQFLVAASLLAGMTLCIVFLLLALSKIALFWSSPALAQIYEFLASLIGAFGFLLTCMTLGRIAQIYETARELIEKRKGAQSSLP
ncbi:hypothetical protein [Agrobacterium tumefaciens]|uniref:hypothetical protein n=1 Tax=Agrobacterium tumefaciens TaxID=358 RepID=UPI00046EB4D1